MISPKNNNTLSANVGKTKIILISPMNYPLMIIVVKDYVIVVSRLTLNTSNTFRCMPHNYYPLI